MAKVIMKDFKELIVGLVEHNRWPSSNMVIHDIDKMSTAHIVNCIKKIKRDNWRKVYLPLFIEELAHRLIQAEKELSLIKSLENA